MQENLRLRKELEVYVEKAARLQRVSEGVATTVARTTSNLRCEVASAQRSNLSWLTENLHRRVVNPGRTNCTS